MIALRIFFYTTVFCLTLIYFLPKNEIVSFVDNKILQKEKIKTNIILQNKLLQYQADNSEILYDKNPTATIDTITISPYIFYNNVKLEKIKLEGMAGSIFPNKINNATLNYSILNPTQVTIAINGDFGVANGYFDIIKSSLYLELTASNLLKKRYSFILKSMKKSNKKYIYEYQL